MRHSKKSIDVFLQPGNYFVGDAQHRVRTLLGSCVSITLWHPRFRFGAISHFLLSSRADSNHDASPPDGRYGDEVMQLMLAELASLQVKAGECQAKIFGGADMFPGQNRREAEPVGKRNGEAARRLLRENGITVLSESLFGIGHRQIVFDISNGDVWVRQVKPVTAAPQQRMVCP